MAAAAKQDAGAESGSEDEDDLEEDPAVRQAKMNGEIKKHLTQILLEVTDAVLGGRTRRRACTHLRAHACVCFRGRDRGRVIGLYADTVARWYCSSPWLLLKFKCHVEASWPAIQGLAPNCARARWHPPGC